MMEAPIKIELTELEAEAFVKFQKHRAIIGILESVGAFDIKGGSLTIHFDSQGKIGSIDKLQHFRT